ncbi:MAG: threonine/serine exporter family protein [Clostridia bacterium]|nr:threonine/serine exporter family protein [Clostridia bacterium]
MTLTKDEQQSLLHLLLDMGELMYCSGSEVKRVENTLSLMGKAYSAVETSVLVITASIVVTMKFEDGNVVTETRRIQKAGSNKLWRLERLNALSRRCCNNPISLDELHVEIKKCKEPINKEMFYIGSAITAGAFAVFFGGAWCDFLVAAVFALLICVMQKTLSHITPNNIIFNIVCSFVVGVLISFSAKLIPILNVDAIISGDIMLLIPGAAFTNAFRDLIVGDTISGVMRLIECVLWAIGLGIGFMLSIWLVGGIAI